MACSEAELRFPLTHLHSFCSDILTAADVPLEDAALVAESLAQADASGLSGHGMVRLLPVYVRRLQAGTTRSQPRMEVVQRRPGAALLDGDAGLRQVVGAQAMWLAIEMAQENGIGIVGVRRSSHFGTGAFLCSEPSAPGWWDLH
jgi:LDH2 family malate/lactate/ureidoglycolate dehydrogenase